MRISILFVTLLWLAKAFGQSIEIMPGTENVFVDVQFLKPLKQNDYRFSVFSRTRGIVDYENNANILSAAYVSYTSKPGVGFSLIGSMSSFSGASSAVGVNYLKAGKNYSVFALAAVELQNEPGYSFFSIAKYFPRISENCKGYFSLELFTLFNRFGHQISVERARLGLDYKRLQFGLGANLDQFGEAFSFGGNYGIFIRKEF